MAEQVETCDQEHCTLLATAILIGYIKICIILNMSLSCKLFVIMVECLTSEYRIYHFFKYKYIILQPSLGKLYFNWYHELQKMTYCDPHSSWHPKRYHPQHSGNDSTALLCTHKRNPISRPHIPAMGWQDINGLMQKRHNSSALAMELCLFLH